MDRPKLPPNVRDRLVRALAAGGERVGLSVVPAHFYGSVAGRADLRARQDWRRPFVPHGLHWSLDDQTAWLERVVTDATRASDDDRRAIDELGRVGSGYGFVEEVVLFAFVRHFAPPRIVEIGSGRSTAIMRQASGRNRSDGASTSAITAYDPYSTLPNAVRADVDVRDIALQDATEDVVAELAAGDLLFIDSSHAVKTGSEVHRIYLDLIPRLPAGVHVHIHDIYLPYLHHPAILAEDLWDWQETALLAALLTDSSRLEISCSLSALAHDDPDRIGRCVPGYRPRRTDAGGLFVDVEGHFPASTWLRTIAS